MTRILALIAIFFAFAVPSAMAKNDYSCDKHFIFFKLFLVNDIKYFTLH